MVEYHRHCTFIKCLLHFLIFFVTLDKRISVSVATSELLCTTSSDCTAEDSLGKYGYCYAGKCICRRGSSVLINGTCEPQLYCKTVCTY